MTASATDYAIDWREAGSCLGMDPDLFFPISQTGLTLDQIRRAKSVCAGCPVRQACLRFAMESRETHGIWGGATPEERRGELRRRAKRAQRLRRRGWREIDEGRRRGVRRRGQRSPTAGLRAVHRTGAAHPAEVVDIIPIELPPSAFRVLAVLDARACAGIHSAGGRGAAA